MIDQALKAPHLIGFTGCVLTQACRAGWDP